MKLKVLAGVVTGLIMASSASAESIMVSDAWIREAPPGAKALAGYMQIKNDSKEQRVLVEAESPAFDSVMLHKTVMEGTMAKMVHQEMIPISAGSGVTFEPNGYHLMMMKPKQPLRAGDKVPVTLTFKNGESLVADHEVRGMEGDGGGHEHHHH